MKKQPRECETRDARLRREDAKLLAHIVKETNGAVKTLPYRRVTFRARSGRWLVRMTTNEKQFQRLMRRETATEFT